MALKDELLKILTAFNFRIERLKPSEFAEKYRVMTSEVSPFPGRFSYDLTPYLREVIDTMDPQHPGHTFAVMKGAQLGYSLDNQTVIPTPTGWTTMGELKCGDFVFGDDGKPTKVLTVTDTMYNHECYNVCFVDGSIITADADHLWYVKDRKVGKNVVKNTKFLSETIILNGANRYAVQNTKPLQLDTQDLNIEPYLLGLWLGDGHTGYNDISGLKSDLEHYKNRLNILGVNCDIRHIPSEQKTCLLHITDKNNKERLKGWQSKSFKTNLRKIGVLNYKHIPDVYMRASYNQRLSLLQGLMDTDGSICKRSRTEFTNTNKYLIKQVQELAISLGYTVSFRYSRPAGKMIIKGISCNANTLYKITFAGRLDIPPFSLPRKVKNLKVYDNSNRSKSRRKSIKSIIKVKSVPVKCISVDNESKLFLAGKSMIPTHNSTGVIEPGIGWIMKESPGNILFFVGHAELVPKAMAKVDQMIDSCGLRELIRPNAMRKKSQKTGDTNTAKEFPGGSLTLGSVGNAKAIRQLSVRYGFIDDYESIPGSSKSSGSTHLMIEQRFAAYHDKKKIYYISTPEVQQTSNIEPAFLKGDQRYYFVPCPCCGDYIVFEWEVKDENGNRKGGITWELDPQGKLIEDSVGYTCQECGGFFTDRHKYKMNLLGEWRPTAEPVEKGYLSYHVNSLYAPPGMYDWTHYINKWMQANPKGAEPIESELQTFYNVVLGKTWKLRGKTVKASALALNSGRYQIGTVPTDLSVQDGNGPIFMLTLGSDLNGIVEDARLDYEVIAWATNGTRYAVDMGSIGTFIPRENTRKNKIDRERWTYNHNYPNAVWDDFADVLNSKFMGDNGKEFEIMCGGLDTGHYTAQAYEFIDSFEGPLLFGLKGNKSDKYRSSNSDTPVVKRARERDNLYLVEVNQLKDALAEHIGLSWDESTGAAQPAGFLNFPAGDGIKFSMRHYYSHFEAEHRVEEKNAKGETTGFRWVKRKSSAQNHLYDCHIYNMAIANLLPVLVCKEQGIKEPSWGQFVEIMTG